MKSFVVFEGYDGSGKTSLIRELKKFTDISTYLVGRKAEFELVGIASILEQEEVRPSAAAEMLLRIAVEVERGRIAERISASVDLPIFDRGIVSLISWFDYLDVDRAAYEPLIQECLNYYQNAFTVVCRADFDTCWERSSSRPEEQKSRKDRLGKEVNRRFFMQYESNLLKYADRNPDLLLVDTVDSSVDESMQVIRTTLENRGLIRL